MIIGFIKRQFIKPTVEDKANFYTFQSIMEKRPRWEYTITDCSDGFIKLIERYYKCIVNESQKTINMRIDNPIRGKTIVYDKEVLTQELLDLKKGVS